MDKKNNQRLRLSIPDRNKGPSTHHKVNDKSPSSYVSPQEAARKKLGRYFSKKTQLTMGALVALLIIGIAVIQLASKNDLVNAETDKSIVQPEYRTVLPNGKTAKELGGWSRVSPADKDPVFAYVDRIDDVAISVSQQPLPDAFVGDVDEKLAELAKRFSATTKLSAANGNLYIGISVKGPQSALTVKDDTLIMIKSEKKIDAQAWIAYIDSLGLTY